MQRYNWDGLSERLQEDMAKDYKRKRIIRGVKRGVSIVLAAGIGTVGLYEAYKYLNEKISEYRKTKSAYEINIGQIPTPNYNYGLPVYTASPKPIQTAEVQTIKEDNRLVQLSRVVPKNKQISKAITECENMNFNGINGYSEFEELLVSQDSDKQKQFAENGVLYFINMERKLISSYIVDCIPSMYMEANGIKATYERSGNKYQFHIRYKNGRNTITISSPKLERTNTGELKYIEGTSSSLPISVYERLIFIGEHNRYKKEDGTGIDLQKYANAYTNGDVEKAIILLQEKTKNEEIQLINMIEEKYCIKQKEEER